MLTLNALVELLDEILAKLDVLDRVKGLHGEMNAKQHLQWPQHESRALCCTGGQSPRLQAPRLTCLVLLFVRHNRKCRACQLVMDRCCERVAVRSHGHVHNSDHLPISLVGFLYVASIDPF